MSRHTAAEIKPRLSLEAAVFAPHDEEFPRLISRWREYHAPNVAALVQVASESDIQEAVSQQVNPHDLRFRLFCLSVC